MPERIHYPPTKGVEVIDDYHGTKVADPYRWLEDLDAPEVAEWVKLQNEVTFGYLEKIPERDRIRRRLTELWDFERYTPPWTRGGRYFFTHNDGLQNQDVLFWMPGIDAQPRVLLDPNLLSEEGTIALVGASVSDDGRLLAYGLSTAGTDWMEWRLREVESGRDLSDHLRWIKFSGVSWLPDASGLFYSRYDQPAGDQKLQDPNHFQKLFFHRVGTPQSEDVLVYHRPERKQWGFNGSVTEDGRYLIISVWKGTHPEKQIFYKDLETDGEVVELITGFDASYTFVGNDGSKLFILTDLDASRRRLIAIDLDRPERQNWRELIPESNDPLQSVSLVGDRFICHYLHDAHSNVKVFGLEGDFERDVELPGLGTVTGFGGRRSDQETFYAFTTFATPPTVYRYNIDGGESYLWQKPQLSFDPDAFETTQIFYNSKDGTRVPMFISHRRDIQPNGELPVLLQGYGGFNSPQTPIFSPGAIVWMEMGGVFCLANIRGGGEYGEEWHRAGCLENRQNVFDDFIAAAEWLIADGWTNSERLAIAGGSNGGLLVGACMTQRPELFGACLIAVGVLDMLRFHRFTIGWAWVSDYGCADDPEQFNLLYAYSPYHNLKRGDSYPATLLTTADHDDRVVPSHSFKFTAALQAAQGGEAPCLLRVTVEAGHGMGKPTRKIIDEWADRYAFLVKNFEVELPAKLGAG